jgi:hypothetical protein
MLNAFVPVSLVIYLPSLYKQVFCSTLTGRNHNTIIGTIVYWCVCVYVCVCVDQMSVGQMPNGIRPKDVAP